jgi:Mg/Co/Ni transporter MgtE
VIVTPDATVAEALARLRDPDITPAVASMVFVCRPPAETPTGRYLGLVHIQRLLRVAPSSLASAWLDTDIDPLDPDTSIEDLARYFATYNLVAVPVVDDQHRLLGAVSVDDVLDHLLPDEWRSRPGVAVTRRVQNALGAARKQTDA